MIKLYPDVNKSLQGYKTVFEKLLLMIPEKMDMEIIIERLADEDETYIEVSAKHKYPKSKEEQFSQAIEFTPWNKWLGMEISDRSLHEYSQLEIIAHCLYEMTFVGFAEDEIQNELRSIERSMDDFNAMSEEEKRSNTTSVEDILPSLRDNGIEE